MRPSNNNRGKCYSDIETTAGSTSDRFVDEQFQISHNRGFSKLSKLALLAFSYGLNMSMI